MSVYTMLDGYKMENKKNSSKDDKNVSLKTAPVHKLVTPGTSIDFQWLQRDLACVTCNLIVDCSGPKCSWPPRVVLLGSKRRKKEQTHNSTWEHVREQEKHVKNIHEKEIAAITGSQMRCPSSAERKGNFKKAGRTSRGSETLASRAVCWRLSDCYVNHTTNATQHFRETRYKHS